MKMVTEIVTFGTCRELYPELSLASSVFLAKLSVHLRLTKHKSVFHLMSSLRSINDYHLSTGFGLTIERSTANFHTIMLYLITQVLMLSCSTLEHTLKSRTCAISMQRFIAGDPRKAFRKQRIPTISAIST